MNKRSNTLAKSQRGVSLIEILISVLVFGVGILGLSGLQIASLKGSNNAHYRTTASVLAADLADRMRSNLNAVSDGRYGEAVSCSNELRLCRRNSACSIEELAIFDIQETKCGSRRGSGSSIRREGGVQGLLPNGQMTITCDGGSCITPRNTTSATHNILITWNVQKTDGKQTGDDQTRSLALPVIP